LQRNSWYLVRRASARERSTLYVARRQKKKGWGGGQRTSGRT